jgi:hypothetical protein
LSQEEDWIEEWEEVYISGTTRATARSSFTHLAHHSAALPLIKLTASRAFPSLLTFCNVVRRQRAQNLPSGANSEFTQHEERLQLPLWHSSTGRPGRSSALRSPQPRSTGSINPESITDSISTHHAIHRTSSMRSHTNQPQDPRPATAETPPMLSDRPPVRRFNATRRHDPAFWLHRAFSAPRTLGVTGDTGRMGSAERSVDRLRFLAKTTPFPRDFGLSILVV